MVGRDALESLVSGLIAYASLFLHTFMPVPQSIVHDVLER